MAYAGANSRSSDQTPFEKQLEFEQLVCMNNHHYFHTKLIAEAALIILLMSAVLLVGIEAFGN